MNKVIAFWVFAFYIKLVASMPYENRPINHLPVVPQNQGSFRDEDNWNRVPACEQPSVPEIPNTQRGYQNPGRNAQATRNAYTGNEKFEKFFQPPQQQFLLNYNQLPQQEYIEHEGRETAIARATAIAGGSPQYAYEHGRDSNNYLPEQQRQNEDNVVYYARPQQPQVQYPNYEPSPHRNVQHLSNPDQLTIVKIQHAAPNSLEYYQNLRNSPNVVRIPVGHSQAAPVNTYAQATAVARASDTTYPIKPVAPITPIPTGPTAVTNKPVAPETSVAPGPPETPAEPEPPCATEAPAASKAPTAPETSAKSEPPCATEAPAKSEPPCTTEAPAASKAPTAPETSPNTEPLCVTEAPAEPEPPCATEVPAEPEPPCATEAPAASKAPTAPETSPNLEPPCATEAPAKPEPPCATEAPAEPEPPCATEAPAVSKAPTAPETSPNSEPPCATEAPAEPEPPCATEASAEPEPPCATEAPADPESRAAPEDPAA